MFQIQLISNIIDNFYLCFLFRLKFLLNFFVIFFKKFMILLSSNYRLSQSFNSFIEIVLFGLLKGYYFYIQLFGAGFKFKLIVNDLYFGLIFRLGYSHLIYNCLNLNFRFSLVNKLSIFFYNNNLWYLKNKINYIKLKRKPNIYKEKGILSKNEIFVLKKSARLKF